MVRKNILSLLIALVIMVLSFTSAGTFSRLHLPPIPNLDKLVHIIMYFSLMLALEIENRSLLSTARSYLSLAVIHLHFGGAIEILQSMFTRTRTGDILDYAADALGVLLAVMVWLIIRKLIKSGVR